MASGQEREAVRSGVRQGRTSTRTNGIEEKTIGQQGIQAGGAYG